MKQVILSKGFKSGSLEVKPHAIIDKGIEMFDVDTALAIMDIIMDGGVVDFDGGVEVEGLDKVELV